MFQKNKIELKKIKCIGWTLKSPRKQKNKVKSICLPTIIDNCEMTNENDHVYIG